MTGDTRIKTITLLLFIGWQLYWNITAKKAEKAKPKTKQPTFYVTLRTYSNHILGIILLLQLLGFKFFSFPHSPSLQILGFIIVVCGITISVLARITLNANWTHAFEYQIKKNHELVTTGLYGYIRHPIYTGLIMAYTGAEIVMGSYLFIFFFLLLFWIFNRNAIKEETLLKEHFGQRYEFYLKNTSRFLPHIY